MKKTRAYQAFIFLLILVIIMGLATCQEHLKGTEYVFTHFYKTTWFTLLWTWLAVCGGYYIVKSGLHKKLPVFVLHLSLLLILVGAMITRFTGKTGLVHLRQGEEIGMFDCEESNRPLPLPFSMMLKEFRVEYYPGTSSPSDYVSIVEVKDNESGEVFRETISMNNILKYKSYRFYQSSFDDDMSGSFLSVNHDIAGITCTYIGYYLLFFSMIWVLFDRRGRFFELRKKNFMNSNISESNISESDISDSNFRASKSSNSKFSASKFSISKSARPTIILFFLFLPVMLYASQSGKNFNEITVDKERAAHFSEMWVDYHGRVCPLQTMAIDYTTKITGKPDFEGLSSEQFLLGWVFFPEEWQRVPLFEIKHPELKELINTSGMACVDDFMDSSGEYKLAGYWKQMRTTNQSSILKEASKLDEKIQLISMLRNGSLLKMSETREVPSRTHLKAELLYNKLSVFSLLFKIILTIGCAGMFFFIFYTVKNKEYRKIHTVFYVLLLLSFAILTAGMALRGYIAGRLPMSNGYETMLFVAWIALFVGVLFRRSSFLITNFSFLLSGFTLLVAHIGAMNPHITPLVPVLQSPLLNIHVSLIMISYGLCGFMLLNSLTSFLLMAFSGKKAETKQMVVRLKEMSELFMYPATFLLGAGIFVGAIWANVSWGRYWGWDPKEVWALITFLLMSFSFHRKTIYWFRNPVFYHVFVIIIFLAVLMTYFGVNYILGGKHSYAG